MALPKINVATYELNLPSSNEIVKFRPFLVKEEKILLMAMESEETNDMMNAIKQIISNCVISSKLKVEELPLFDLEYMFIKLRAKSVGEKTKIGMKCLECDTSTEVEVNLDEVEVIKGENHDPKIQLTDEIGVVMKYPKLNIMENIGDINNVEDGFAVLRKSIEMIFTGDEVYEAKDHSEKELDDFLNSLTRDQFQKIQDFFDGLPKLKKDVKWNCSGCQKEREVTLEGMNAFFG